jgi:hypothetical protein
MPLPNVPTPPPTQSPPTSTLSVEPPPVPRPITRTARRRAWAEPRTRAWLLSAIVLFIIAASCLVQESATWRSSTTILSKNTPVSAVIAAIDGTDRTGYSVSASEAKCTFKFTYNGQNYSVDGSIADQADDTGLAVVGKKLTLHIDPADPANRWTAVSGNTALAVQLVGFWVTLPIALLLFALAFWQHSRLLAIWTSGRDLVCIVVDTNQSALAPLSLSVRCTPVHGFERHVVTVVVPRRLANPRTGDELWVVFPRDKIESAIAAACFFEPDSAALANSPLETPPSTGPGA